MIPFRPDRCGDRGQPIVGVPSSVDELAFDKNVRRRRLSQNIVEHRQQVFVAVTATLGDHGSSPKP